jgi:histidinol-phosphate aminotransferase
MAARRPKRPRQRRRAPPRIHTRLERNESPFGTSPAVLAAWERQRTADRRKYGLNRYPDFFRTDMVQALADHHGLSPLNYTPVAGPGEVGTVLAAALLRRPDSELLQPWPIDDPLSRAALAWGARVRRVDLDARHRQDLRALAARVGPHTRLVHLQNPHDPGGDSFGAAELEAFLSAVAARNGEAYVWVDEAHIHYAGRPDLPDGFALIGRDPEGWSPPGPGRRCPAGSTRVTRRCCAGSRTCSTPPRS